MIAAILTHALYTGIPTGVVFLVGRDLIRSLRRKGQHRRAYHGWYVWCWMLLGGFVGMAALPCFDWPDFWAAPPTNAGGYGAMFGFGLLGGWAVGMVHGAVMLRHFVEPPAGESEPKGDE